MFQIDTSISLIKKYIDEETEALFYSLDELKTLAIKYLNNSQTVGIVLHHRYHNSHEKLELLISFIEWLENL